MKKIIFLIALIFLQACKSDNVVGKKILCGRLDSIWDNIRSYEFISQDKVIERKLMISESDYILKKDKKYEVKPEEIIIYLHNWNTDEWIIGDIVNRRYLSIEHPFFLSNGERDVTPNDEKFEKGECKIIKGDIELAMKKLRSQLISQKDNNNFIDKVKNFINKVKNFINKLFYKI